MATPPAFPRRCRSAWRSATSHAAVNSSQARRRTPTSGSSRRAHGSSREVTDWRAGRLERERLGVLFLFLFQFDPVGIHSAVRLTFACEVYSQPITQPLAWSLGELGVVIGDDAVASCRERQRGTGA